MSQRLLLFALIWMLSWCVSTAQAQIARTAIITQDEARRHGLHRAWMTQVEMDRTKDRVRSVVLYQPQPKPPEAAEPKQGEPLKLGEEQAEENPAADNNNPFGNNQGAADSNNPFGADQPAAADAGADVDAGADADAADPADADAAAQPAASPAAPKSFSYPGEPGMLLVQTELGLLHALDAETGRTIWVQQVGSRSRPSETPAVNDKYVAVVNGMELYLLERKNGRLIWQRRLTNVSVSGPTLSDNFVYALAVDGKLSAFDIEDPSRNWHYSSFGRVAAPLIVTRRAMAWASDRGHVYMSQIDTPTLSGRFESGKPFTAQLTYWPPLIYAPSQDGYLYALSEIDGSAVWRHSVGEALRQPATPIGDTVYVISEIGGLLALSADRGLEKWFVPHIEQFLAASPTRLYAMDSGRRLVALNRETGAPITSMALPGMDLLFSNRQSDRLYVGTSTGMIQCLHEIGQEKPMVHTFPPAPAVKTRANRGNQAQQ